MKIQQVAPSQTFCGSNPKRGARHIGQVLNKLYEAAYRDMPQQSDIIQISTKLNNSLEVTRKYNEVVTKGKAYK